MSRKPGRIAEILSAARVRNFKTEEGVEPMEGFNGCYRQIAKSAQSSTGYIALYINEKRATLELECDYYGRHSREEERLVNGWLLNNEIRVRK